MTELAVHVRDQPILSVMIYDADTAQPVTPTAGRLLILEPGAATSTEVLFAAFDVEPGGVVGLVEYTFPDPITVDGRWQFWWEFTAGVQGAEPYHFYANPQTVAEPTP
jgi:hypothetical protein